MADKSLPSIQSRVKIVQIEKRKEEMNMKKFFAILMTLALMLSLAVPAMAANEPTTGTIENETGRPYKAYQIFKGTQAEGNEVLGDIEWGTGIDSSKFLTALKTLEVNGAIPFASCNTASDVANVLKNESNGSEMAKAFANLVENHTQGDGTDIAANATVTISSGYYIVIDQTVVEGQVDKVRNAALLQVTNGSSMKITEKNTVPSVEKTVDKNDVNIGETVTFTLTATMPSKMEGYEAYKVVFHDTMSKGLTFGSITSVTIGDSNKDVTNAFKLEPASPSASATGETTFTLTCDDVLAAGVDAEAGDTIVVKYTAIIDSDAVIGTEGNPNKVYLQYSNDPQSNGTGKTPEKKVDVYTWEIPVFKYTGTNTPLAGAGFTLYKVVGETETVVNVVAANNAEGVPAYKVCTKDGCTDHTHATEIVTNAGGKFEIEGLEQGTYVLKETTTPAGYNTAADTTVTIGADGKLNLTTDSDNKEIYETEIKILNNAGATLPETGGMGTTIFYIVGGIMVVAAVVLLVTKKRMSAEG